MKTVRGNKVPAERISSHYYICDLIYFEYPLLKLVSDGKNNWLYLWCDTDSTERDRWIIFPVSRDTLVAYLARKASLRSTMESSSSMYMLEERIVSTEESEKRDGSKPRANRRYLRRVTTSDINDYLPSPDSFFDERFAPDLDLTKQVIPSTYDLPIAGAWFASDFEHFFRRYERVYAFFYATGGRFVKTVNTSLVRWLEQPWTGGSSRVNMFGGLLHGVPAIHMLRIKRMTYNSPGDIQFEAVSSVGDQVRRAALLYLQNEDEIDAAYKTIKQTLTATKANKLNASKLPDSGIPGLDTLRISVLLGACSAIGKALDVELELHSLRGHAPNTVVYAKAVNALVRQIMRLASLQRDEMLNFPSLDDEDGPSDLPSP